MIYQTHTLMNPPWGESKCNIILYLDFTFSVKTLEMNFLVNNKISKTTIKKNSQIKVLYDMPYILMLKYNSTMKKKKIKDKK